MTRTRDELAGLRVLIVEDVWLVADELAQTLEDWGCVVVGPEGRLEDGLAQARTTTLDGAVLDVDLGGVESFPIAAALQARGVPFVFMSGHDAAFAFPPRFAAFLRLPKPVDPNLLARAMARSFAPPGRALLDPALDRFLVG